MSSTDYIPLALKVDHNNSLEFTLELVDQNTGNPVDLTTASIWFTAKANLDDEDSAAVVQVTKADGGIIVSGIGHNVLTVRADHIASGLANESMTVDCDVKVQLPDNYAQCVAKGKLKIAPAVTRSP